MRSGPLVISVGKIRTPSGLNNKMIFRQDFLFLFRGKLFLTAINYMVKTGITRGLKHKLKKMRALYRLNTIY